MIALIPVAGYATRLYPLTKERPKALLDVGKQPMIERVLRKIEKLKGIEKVVIVSNHLFAGQFEEWAQSVKTRIPLLVLDDRTDSNETRLGAVGDAFFAIQQAGIDSDLVWVSGDNLFTFSLEKMQRDFESRQADIIGCFDVKTREEARKMGVLELDQERRITDFVEKPQEPKSTLASCGIYFFSRETVRLFKVYLEAGNNPDKIGEFVAWLYRRKPVYGFVFDRPSDQWFDIGSFEMLEQARKKFP